MKFTLLLILSIWILASVVLGVIVGRAIRNIDRNEALDDELVNGADEWRGKNVKAIIEKSIFTKS